MITRRLTCKALKFKLQKNDTKERPCAYILPYELTYSLFIGTISFVYVVLDLLHDGKRKKKKEN